MEMESEAPPEDPVQTLGITLPAPVEETPVDLKAVAASLGAKEMANLTLGAENLRLRRENEELRGVISRLARAHLAAIRSQ